MRLTRLLAVLIVFALCVSAEAQQPKKIPRIGYLSGTGDSQTPGYQVEAFREGLCDLGYVEERNILVEYRYIEGHTDRIPNLVSELLKLKVDIVVLTNPPAIRAAKATKTIPIVVVTTEDPVAAGIVDSLAHPGENITGLTLLGRNLSGKRLELLQETVPGISRVAVLWDANAPGPIIGFKEYEATARALKIPLQSLEVRGPNPDLDERSQACGSACRAADQVRVRDKSENGEADRFDDTARRISTGDQNHSLSVRREARGLSKSQERKR